MKKCKFVIVSILAITTFVFFQSLNCEAGTVSISPGVQIFTPGCTATFVVKKDDDEVIVSGPTVSGDGVKASGENTISFSKPAIADVSVKFQKTDPQDPQSEITTIVKATAKAVQVALTPVANGSESPVLSPKICLNAQPKYKKATWKATVLPEGTKASLEVLYGDITATPNSKIENGNKIKIKGNGTGKYKIKLTHDDLDSCDAEAKSVVFILKFNAKKANSNSGIAGKAKINEATGSINAQKISWPDGTQNAGYVRWFYNAIVKTKPLGAYDGGKVKEKLTVKMNAVGSMKISNYAKPINMSNIGCGVSFGPVSVSVSGNSSEGANYGTSVAGANTEIKIASLPAAQLGDVKHDYSEVGFPWLMATKSKKWRTQLKQIENDKNRTIQVGKPVKIWCRLGAGSNASLIQLVSTSVPQNFQKIRNIQIKRKKKKYEITN